jgi:biopolymer transport protein ExbB/TolQ
MEILLFIFFLVVFIALLVGGYIFKKLRDFKKAVEQAADQKQQRFREEIGRQRQQYSQRQNTQGSQGAFNTQDSRTSQNTQSGAEQEEARRTQTATGETIIDQQHQKRENKKIFDDSDGEYVDFEEA